jgi:hypothetical protein
MRSEVALSPRLHFEHWVMLEASPEVEAFCPFPLKITAWVDGYFVRTRFDFWVRLRDGTERFEQICYDHRRPSPREKRARKACFRWSRAKNQAFRVVRESRVRANPILLANWRYILGFYDQRSYRPQLPRFARVKGEILMFVQGRRSLRVHELLNAFRAKHGITTARFALFDLLRAGELRAQLETRHFDPDSFLSLP